MFVLLTSDENELNDSFHLCVVCVLAHVRIS